MFFPSLLLFADSVASNDTRQHETRHTLTLFSCLSFQLWLTRPGRRRGRTVFGNVETIWHFLKSDFLMGPFIRDEMF